MIFQGKAITVTAHDQGIAELTFDLQQQSVNKFNQLTLLELKEAVAALAASNSAGLLVTSAKDSFIVGADIGEFLTWFQQSEAAVIDRLLAANTIFNAVEDLPFPSVAAINGICLGGGMEMALACDYRVMASRARVGLPEVKLGLFPGFGGTVRLSRLIGVDNALEWIATGSEKRAEDAFRDGAVDAIASQETIVQQAYALLLRVMAGELDYRARRAEKKGKLKLNAIESMMAFETAKGFIGAKAGKHYPAPVAAVKAMQKHAEFERDAAIAIEAKGFAKVAKTAVARNLIGLFLNDQQIKKINKQHTAAAIPVQQAAVLGAGIMGGGIAYQSAYKGTSIVMKDINEAGIQLGLDEAGKLLTKAVERKKLTVPAMAETLNRIRPTLSYGDFAHVDVVIEAVVENAEVKKKVLAEAESHLKDGAVLASNTSTISITELAKSLSRPEAFCGMHFFNPVHRMPLVEVIRGEQSAPQTIATVVAYAQQMGKTPIVVNDCPGFLVNRILFPYFGAFAALLRDGANFEQVDKVMESFGWPMGPAYLMDVVGIDTGVHAQAVMAAGFPDRMQQDFTSAMDVMFAEKRLGQKNGHGFYRYETDKKGKPKKLGDETAHQLVASVSQSTSSAFSEQEVIDRMMIPLCLEAVRCLEDGIVDSAAEVDMGLIYGIGFPPFRGGALKYIDAIGTADFVKQCAGFASLGPLYLPTEALRAMAANNKTFYS